MTKHERDLKAIKQVRAKKAKEIEEIWAIESKEGRNLEEAEREQVLELTKNLDELRRQQDEVEANIALEKKVKEASGAIVDEEPKTSPDLGRLGGITVGPTHEAPKSLGQQFVESKAYQNLFGEGRRPQGVDWKSDTVELNTKATVLSGGTVSGSGPYQQYVPGIVQIADQPLTVADLLPTGVATAPQIQFFKERVATNAAAGVQEGAAKPESTFDFQADSASLAKIATFLPISDEITSVVS